MDRPGAFIERYRRWAYDMRDAFRALSSDPDYRYGFDPYWVRAEPYRQVLSPGASAEVVLHVRNFRRTRQSHRIEIHPPAGLRTDPVVIAGTLPRETRGAWPFRLQVAPDAAPGVRLVALDVTLDGRRLGAWFDFVVAVAPTPPGPATD
jgi:hypothetical protein